MDWTAAGSLEKKGKSGVIPTNLAPIFERLGIHGQLWTELVTQFESWSSVLRRLDGAGTTVGPAALRLTPAG